MIQNLKVFDEKKVATLRAAELDDATIIKLDAEAWAKVDEETKFQRRQEEKIFGAIKDGDKKVLVVKQNDLSQKEKTIDMKRLLDEQFPGKYILVNTPGVHTVTTSATLYADKDEHYKESTNMLVFREDVPVENLHIHHVDLPSKKIYVKAHYTAGHSWRASDVFQGYKFFYTDSDYKDHYIKSPKTLNRNIEAIISEINYKKAEELRKKSLSEQGLELAKQMFPGATVTAKQEWERDPYKKHSPGRYYDAIEIRFADNSGFQARPTIQKDVLSFWDLKTFWPKDITVEQKMLGLAALWNAEKK